MRQSPHLSLLALRLDFAFLVCMIREGASSPLLVFLLKEAFFFQLLHQRRVDETRRVGAGRFAAEAFQQAFDAFEINGDIFL